EWRYDQNAASSFWSERKKNWSPDCKPRRFRSFRGRCPLRQQRERFHLSTSFAYGWSAMNPAPMLKWRFQIDDVQSGLSRSPTGPSRIETRSSTKHHDAFCPSRSVGRWGTIEED